jgi:hypothetical protein
MRDVATREQVEQWLDHPIVKLAGSRASNPRELLCGLHDVLTELEARFPDVPFARLVLASNATSTQARRERMLDAGVPEHEVDAILAAYPPGDDGGVPSGGFGRTEWLAAADTDLSGPKLAEKFGWTTTKGLRVAALRSEMTAQHEAFAADVRAGASIDATARRHGVTRPTVLQAVRRAEYREWLALRRS